MIKKIHIPKHAIDYAAAIIVVIIQGLIRHFRNDHSEFIYMFIGDTFGTIRFVAIIIPLLSVITYSLYFGNSRLSFIVGFLSTITPDVYFHFFEGISPAFRASVVLGVVFGLTGMLFSMFKRNTGISTRISIHAALLMSLLGIPAVFDALGLNILQILFFLLAFNPALILGLLLSYLIIRDAKKAFVFTFSVLIITFFIITLIKPLLSIIIDHIPLFEFPLFGIIIAIILSASLKAYTYYQAHKTRG